MVEVGAGRLGAVQQALVDQPGRNTQALTLVVGLGQPGEHQARRALGEVVKHDAAITKQQLRARQKLGHGRQVFAGCLDLI